MIARDEAAFLDHCLASVEGLADEVVVVDTGSTDDTRAVARQYRARVLSFPWTGDFSAARNHGLSAARGRWILSLDCDEVIAPSDHDAIRSAMATDDIAGYRLTTRNYTNQADRSEWVATDGTYTEEKDYSGWFPTTKVRLWRQRHAHRFRGAVHELVEASIMESGGRLADCTVPVHHYGLMEKSRAENRYVEAGERKVQATPDDLRARYELAIAYRDAGRLDEALTEINRVTVAIDAGAIDTGGAGDHIYLEEENARLVQGDILDRLQRLDEALAVYQGIAEHFPDSFQAHNNMGSLLGRLGRIEEAHRAYQRATALAPENRVIAENLRKVQRRLEPSNAPASNRYRLSLCIIVKDGADDLDRCLQSVKAAVDEIIVVDTGSTDASVDVAHRHGAQVEHFDWCEDFAAARNASLELATGAWILWMDADDYLLPEDLLKVQRVRQLTPDIALSFSLINTGGADNSSFQQVKMFPNRAGIRFTRPVHETVLPALQAAGIEVRTTDVNVMHTGYADVATVQRKCDRYRRLMEAWLEQHPDDLDVCFRLGHTAYTSGLREQALVYFERVLAAGADIRPSSLRRHALVFRGRCRLESGDWQRSIADFEAALELDNTDVFAHVSLGDALTKSGAHEDALRHLRLGLSGHLEGTYPLDRNLIDYTAHYFLGECLSTLGRIDEAVRAFEAASRVQPDRPEARQALRQLRPSQAVDTGGKVSADFQPPVAVNDQARLTLCMIVRDEESRLGECLASVKDAVDEIVVVDTGSKDNTIDVARTFGARIGHFDWCDDFAAARNESLRLATGDWVLWLDADDRLPAEYVDTIRRLVAGPRDRGYFFVLDDQGYESVSCLQMRLFPNLPGVCFQMPIHEQVTPSLARLGVEMVPTPVRVVHTGYTSSEVVSAKKDRYLRIMESWLVEHPEDYIVRSHVALTYHTTGQLQEAAEQYRIIIEDSDCRRDRNYVILTTSLLFLGRSWHKLGDLAVAMGWMRQAEEVDPEYVLTQFSLAEVLLEQGEAAQSVLHAQKVLNRDHAQLTFFPIDQNELRYSTLHVLGRAQAQLGEMELAEQALRQASEIPVARRSEALGQLSELHKQEREPGKALAALDDALAIEPRHPRHLFNIAMLHLEGGRYDDSRKRFEDVLAVVGEGRTDARIRAMLNLGFIAKTLGDTDGAEARYAEVLLLEPKHTDARANLGHLYLTAGRFAEAVTRFEEVVAAQPGLLDIDLGLLSARLGLGTWDPELARLVLSSVPEAGTVPTVLTQEHAAEAFLQVGAALIRRNLPRCAEMALQIALSLQTGQDVRARRCLGELYFSQRRFWDAVTAYEAVLRAAPDDTDAFRRLGDTYAELGVADAADLCYARARGSTS